MTHRVQCMMRAVCWHSITHDTGAGSPRSAGPRWGHKVCSHVAEPPAAANTVLSDLSADCSADCAVLFNSKLLLPVPSMAVCAVLLHNNASMRL
jgi:hypothetical protein